MIFEAEIITREKFGVEHGRQSKDGILFVLDGVFEFSIMGQHNTAQSGDICVFCKDTLFDRKVLRSLRCVYVRFDSFPVSLASGLLRTADPVRTGNTISHLAKAVEQRDQELTEHLLRDILLFYQRQNDGTQTESMIADCIAWFSHHYAEHITLDLLAQKYSMSKQGLIKKFRKHTGKTIMEYLTSVRIAHSKDLLQNTSRSVSEIAAQCGYDNVYYFSNSFKRMTGLSPSAYRRSASL